MKRLFYSLSPLFVVLLGACGGSEEMRWAEEQWALIQSLALPESWSSMSPTDPEQERREVALGRELFFDNRLSRSGQVACATCHRPERLFSDGRAQAVGEATLMRNTPTLLGAGELSFLGWDGRKDSVWSQSLAPLEAPREHDLTRMDVARRMFEHHAVRYAELFPEGLPDFNDPRFPPAARPIPSQPEHPEHRAWVGMSEADRGMVDEVFVRVGKLLAAYVQRLLPRPAPFDAYVSDVRAGDPRGGGHLSHEALRGLEAFIGVAGCVTCHHGPLLSDGEFHNLGLPAVLGIPDREAGRAEGARQVKVDEFRCGSPHAKPAPCSSLRFLDPSFPDFIGAFKTPTLRNVAETGPYMHAGQFLSLEAVVEFYRSLPASPWCGVRDPLLNRVERSARTSALVEFLRSLSGPAPEL